LLQEGALIVDDEFTEVVVLLPARSPKAPSLIETLGALVVCLGPELGRVIAP
jgi:hypothetical protein